MRTPFFGALLAASVLATPALAQLQPTSTRPLPPRECYSFNDDPDAYSEERTYQLAASDLLRLDAGGMGGITVVGTDDPTIEVKAKVTASGKGEAGRRHAAQIQLDLRDGWLRPSGTIAKGSHDWWAVSFELRVPRAQALELKATMGGIVLTDLTGKISFQTTNGGVLLTNLNGDVKGRTTNGGVVVKLAGKQWTGAGLDVTTTNGGIVWEIPADYKATITSNTLHGNIANSFEDGGPATTAKVDKTAGKSISLTLQQGGAPLHVGTTNGGIVVRKS